MIPSTFTRSLVAPTSVHCQLTEAVSSIYLTQWVFVSCQGFL